VVALALEMYVRCFSGCCGWGSNEAKACSSSSKQQAASSKAAAATTRICSKVKINKKMKSVGADVYC